MHVLFFLMVGFFGFVLVFLVLWTLCAHERFSKIATVLQRCYIVGFAIGLAFFMTLQGLLISSARTEQTQVDCIIILGAGLRNSAPGQILRTRLDAAIAFLQTQGDIPVIVAGGLGEGESITEAEAMSRYLIARGIDESRIWQEGSSTRTLENLAFSLAIMEENGMDVSNVTVGIVSNEFHLFRAKLIAGNLGMDAVGVAASTPGFSTRVLYFSREAFALARELIF